MVDNDIKVKSNIKSKPMEILNSSSFWSSYFDDKWSMKEEIHEFLLSFLAIYFAILLKSENTYSHSNEYHHLFFLSVIWKQLKPKNCIVICNWYEYHRISSHKLQNNFWDNLSGEQWPWYPNSLPRINLKRNL